MLSVIQKTVRNRGKMKLYSTCVTAKTFDGHGHCLFRICSFSIHLNPHLTLKNAVVITYCFVVYRTALKSNSF